MGFDEFLKNETHRQHLNLSESAWDIIDSDMRMFQNTLREVTLSGFLNLIFLNYYEKSPANLSNAIHAYREDCRQAMTSSKALHQISNSDMNAILDALTENRICRLKDQLLRFPKGTGRKFRLNNEAFQLIRSIPDNSYDCLIYGRPGKLLKALFETYCRLPFVEREKLVFSKRIDTIEMATHMKALLKLETLDGQAYHLIPYKILTDLSSNFNYVAGYSAAAGSHCYVASSFRLSRMSNLRCVPGQKAELTPAQKKELETSISSKGVQFLLRDFITAYVKLSNDGVRKYQTQLHLRPPYSQVHPDQVYEFQATKEQLLYYFFKFGKDAFVVSPQSLQKELRQMYQDALDCYTVSITES